MCIIITCLHQFHLAVSGFAQELISAQAQPFANAYHYTIASTTAIIIITGVQMLPLGMPVHVQQTLSQGGGKEHSRRRVAVGLVATFEEPQSLAWHRQSSRGLCLASAATAAAITAAHCLEGLRKATVGRRRRRRRLSPLVMMVQEQLPLIQGGFTVGRAHGHAARLALKLPRSADGPFFFPE